MRKLVIEIKEVCGSCQGDGRQRYVEQNYLRHYGTNAVILCGDCVGAGYVSSHKIKATVSDDPLDVYEVIHDVGNAVLKMAKDVEL